MEAYEWKQVLLLFLILLLLIILHLHRVPHSHEDKLDEHTVKFIEDEADVGAGAG